MGSETVAARIPLVDLSGEKLKAGSESWNSACQEVRRALEDYGCFELVYSKYNIDFNNTLLRALEELFKLSRETKKQNINPKPAHGYLGKNSNFPIHEAMAIEFATDKQKCQNFTQDIWPHGNQHFCDTVHSYAKQVAEMLDLMVKMLCESYGIEKEYGESRIESSTYLIRMLNYKRSEGDTKIGVGGHTDKSFMTIQHQNDVNGLEIRFGDQWIFYEPSVHSSFLVIVGDACMGWSNDRLKSCYHRVTMESEEDRYAVGLFSIWNGLIEVPKELVDEEHPLKYKSFEHQQLIDFFHASNDPNKKNVNMVKAFCGI